MTGKPPTIEWVLSTMNKINNDDGGLAGNCYGCLFAVGPVNRHGEPTELGKNDDPRQERYKCTMPTRAEDAKLVDWGSRATCTSGEWARWVSLEASRLQHEADVLALQLSGHPAGQQMADYLQHVWMGTRL